MARFFASLLLVLVSSVSAETVSVQCSSCDLVTFLRSTYRAILKMDYVVGASLAGFSGTVTVNVQAIERDQVPTLLEGVLRSSGVAVRKVGSVVFFERASLSSDSSSIPSGATGLVAAMPVAKPSLPVHLADGSQVVPVSGASFAPSLADRKSPPAKPSQPDSLPPAVSAPVAAKVEVYKPQARSVAYLSSLLSSVAIGSGSVTSGGDALLLYGDDDRLKAYADVLAKLDTDPGSVVVRAAIVEVGSSSIDQFGFAFVFNSVAVEAGYRLEAQGSTFRLTGGGLDMLLTKLKGDSRFRFISAPVARVVDGESTRFLVGSDVPILGNSIITQQGTVQGVEYRQAGLILRVSPRIYGRRIQAKLEQEISQVVTTTSSKINSPTLNKRQLETVLDAAPGELVVLAGLDELAEAWGKSGPFAWLPNEWKTDSRRSSLLLVLQFDPV